MNWPEAFLWGFVATLVLTTILSGTRGLGMTRMDISFMLGTMFTADRDRARWIGFIVHLLNGWVFALIYLIAFHSTGWLNVWFGIAIGVVHAAFVLVAGMSLLPSIHPRMASEQDGPTPTRVLEPPGFLALHYGRQTPISTLVAHIVYGAILGFFYSGHALCSINGL